MTTTIWFSQEGKKYYAKLALQNGRAEVLEAKTEEGKIVDPEFVQLSAHRAYKKINSWGGLPEPEHNILDGTPEEAEGVSKRGR
jgi:hypothetical protein